MQASKLKKTLCLSLFLVFSIQVGHAAAIKENNNIKIHIMKNSSHYLYSDESKDDITKTLIEMLKNTIVQSNLPLVKS